MVQEFKEFDKQLSRYKGEVLEKDLNIAQKVSHYKYAAEIVRWTHAQVRHAVYHSSTALEWQKFRVSLKGNSTNLKVLRLHYHYEKIRDILYSKYDLKDKQFGFDVKIDDNTDEILLQKIRLDNYIGALRRSGHINAEFRIVR